MLSGFLSLKRLLAAALCLAVLAAAPAAAQQKKVSLIFTNDVLNQIATDNQGEMTEEIIGRITGLSPWISTVRLRRASGRVTLEIAMRPEDDLQLRFKFSLDKMLYYRLKTARADVDGMTASLQEAREAEPLLLGVAYRFDDRYAIVDLTLDLREAIRARDAAAAKDLAAKAVEEAKAAEQAKAAAQAKAAEEAKAAEQARLAEQARVAAEQAKAAEQARLAAAKAPPPPPPPPEEKTKPAPPPVPAPVTYLAVKKLGREAPPVVDGLLSDAAWLGAQQFSFDVQGPSGKMTVSVWGLWSQDRIWFLARWPDDELNDQHRPWVWSREDKAYVAGKDIEDALSISFAKNGRIGDCMLAGNEAVADLWTWRAGRTNPAGSADDATLTLTFTRIPRANYYQTKNGRTVWVKETPDAGTPAYQSQVVGTFSGDRVPRYSSRKPAGSIADVAAKGVWKDGFWTVEFSRKLAAADGGDVAFAPGRDVPFSIAVFDHREGIDHSTSREFLLKLE